MWTKEDLYKELFLDRYQRMERIVVAIYRSDSRITPRDITSLQGWGIRQIFVD